MYPVYPLLGLGPICQLIPRIISDKYHLIAKYDPSAPENASIVLYSPPLSFHSEYILYSFFHQKSELFPAISELIFHQQSGLFYDQ